MKNLWVVLFLFVSVASAQNIIKAGTVTGHSIHIIGNNFQGVIFLNNYYQHAEDTAEKKIKRFTPSNDDILSAESFIITLKLNYKNAGDKKYIFSHLSSYSRQYIGYINEKGKKIIYLNCFPVDEPWANTLVNIHGQKMPAWYNTLFFVFDGGRSFWQMHINITKKKLVSMTINGLA